MAPRSAPTASANGQYTTAVGNYARAYGYDPTAIGVNSTAGGGVTGTGTPANDPTQGYGTAVGYSARSTGAGSTAIGISSLANAEHAYRRRLCLCNRLPFDRDRRIRPGGRIGSLALGRHTGTAGFANSVALGNNSVNTAANQVNIGGRNLAGVNDIAATGNITTGNVVINGTNSTITGLTAVTPVANGNAAATTGQLYQTNLMLASMGSGIADLDAREARNFNYLNSRSEKAFQGVAMGFALTAAPLNLANGEGGISGGVGVFRGEWAGGVRAQYVNESGIGFGANVGVSKDAVGGGVGASFKF